MKTNNIFEIFYYSYANAFQNIVYIFGKCFVLLLLYMISLFLLIAAEHANAFSLLAYLPFENFDDADIQIVLLKAALGFFSLLFALLVGTWVPLAIAIPWHQKLITGGGTASRFYLGLNKTTWRYFLKALVLGLISMGPFVVIEFWNTLSFDSYMFATKEEDCRIPECVGAADFLYLLMTVYWIFIFARLGLVLPAAAVDRPLTFRQSLGLTSGKTISLMAIIFLLSLPLIIYLEPNDLLIDWISRLFQADVPNPPLWTEYAVMALLLAIVSITTLLYLSALSHIYLALMKEPDLGT